MRTKSILLLAVTFTLGLAAGAFAARKAVDSNTYRGKSNEEAAKGLLEIAKTQAGKANWENIAIGRAMYVGGMKGEGQAIFDSVTSKKAETSDWMRIARAYYDAGEWDKARTIFDKVLEKAKDPATLSEIGAYHNLKGDRARAEELFEKALASDGGEVWHTVNMAGSYIGVEPLR